MFLDSLLDVLVREGDDPAFCIGNRFYSYRQLYSGVKSIKKQLGDYDISNHGNIAIVCSDDFGTYASLLAVWFSGCAYVPLGINNPVERNISILKDARATFILSTIDLDADKYAGCTIINPNIDNIVSEDLAVPALKETSLAYILFTSGSTGLPKGVPISHKNLDKFLVNFNNSPFRVTKQDRCLQMFELTFDVSVSSFLPALLAGACVFTVPGNVIKYIHVLKLVQAHKITSIQIVPSIIRLAKPLLKKIDLPDVKNCVLTGEATQVDLLDDWRRVIPKAKIYNYYGPTEATIYCSYYEINESDPKCYNGMLAIGKPIGDMELVIIDNDLQETGHNVKGELLISGSQLTKGYLNNKSMNDGSFIELPIGGAKKVYYRSGDLCFKDSNGDIYYCGRLDKQVKVQGFRVELSEIEVLVRNEFGINNVVVPVEDQSGIIELVLVFEQAEAGLNEKLPDFLKTKLPPYMLPSRFVLVENFPLGMSGKIDVMKLKELVHEP